MLINACYKLGIFLVAFLLISFLTDVDSQLLSMWSSLTLTARVWFCLRLCLVKGEFFFAHGGMLGLNGTV